MNSVSFERFEAARELAQSRITHTQNGSNNAKEAQSAHETTSKVPDWRALIDAKKKEMDDSLTSSISGKVRNTEVEDTAPISGMFKNLGRIANQYMATNMNEKDLAQTPHRKQLGNYIDVSV